MDDSALRALLHLLGERGATDLHLKPGSPPKVRRKGILEAVPDEPALTRQDLDDIAVQVFGAVEIVTHGNRPASATYVVDGVGRFRARGYRQRGSIALTMRRIPDHIAPLAELQLPAQIATLAGAPHGLVLVAGPPRSGRRTTLASMLDHANHTRAAHIVSIERPLEILHRDAMGSVSQLEVGADTPTFWSGIEAATQADADVIVVSDLDDCNVAASALEAAEDGLLVLAGIDADHGIAALRRFVDLFPFGRHDSVRIALAGSLVGVTAQRLAPKASGLGRVPVVEVILATSRVLECLLDRDTVGAITSVVSESHELGMQSFECAIADLLEQGVIDLRGALTAAEDWNELHAVMAARGLISQ